MKNSFNSTLILIVLFSFLMFESSFAGALVYSTFLGGASADQVRCIAVDSSENAYITGLTYSSNFPTTPGAFNTLSNGSVDVFVTKVDSTGTALVYSTYLGGGSENWGFGIAVDGSGNAYITGWTSSSTFPTTPGAFDTSFNGLIDVFVTKLNASGTALVYSTYLGGAIWWDQGYAIAVDGSGNAYITGRTWSSNFPTTSGAFDTSFNGIFDIFVTKLNASGTALVYSTYLGGEDYDSGYGIVVDSSGNAYITGWTSSSNFPATPGIFDTSYNGGYSDVFVSKLNASGTALVYSTYLGGGRDDFGNGIAVDGSGNTYITGYTLSSNFPTTLGALDTSYNSGLYEQDVFVSKLNASGTALVYSTYLGGGGDDEGNSIAIDSSGDAYITGNSFFGFPTTPGAFDISYNGGYSDVFVSKLNASGTALVYSTYLGGGNDEVGNGIAVDGSGNAYITGETQSSNFPTTPGAFDTSFNGGYDVFVTKLSLVPLPLSVQEWKLYEE
jgi:hypothetical protein